MSGRAVRLGTALRWVLDVAWYLLLVGGGAAVLVFVVFLALGKNVQAEVPVAFRVRSPSYLTGPGRPVTLTDLNGTLRPGRRRWPGRRS